MDADAEKALTATDIVTLTARVKELEFDCAELSKHNEELRERCKKLATTPPKWPSGYRPRRHVKQG